MTPGALTPEDLEYLLEDASVTQDGGALRELFECDAVLLTETGEQRGREAIVRWVAAAWRRHRTYLGDPEWVLQLRDEALMVSAHSTALARRDVNGRWRYAIASVGFSERQGGTDRECAEQADRAHRGR